MNNSQVAHVWANQSRSSAKGSNFYFDGPTIYSYGGHFPIARFTNKRDANGDRVVLFTTHRYSVTTNGKHIPKARSALYGLPVRVINVPNVGEHCHHPDNLRHFESVFNKGLESAARARKYADMHIRDAEQAQHDCADYCAIFNLDAPAFLNAEISPELIANAKAKSNEARKASLMRDRERQAEEYAIGQEAATAWRHGMSHAQFYLYRGPTMLRLHSSGRMVETSRDAMVPLDAARRLWQMVSECQHTATRLDTPPPVAVGDFQLRSIAQDGTCIVGCHTLTFEECRAFATAQGWTA